MDKYAIVRVLGEGAFGKVLLATNKEEGNAKVAVKEIKNHFKNWDGNNMEMYYFLFCFTTFSLLFDCIF
jgi:serine/threonine protein kinase